MLLRGGRGCGAARWSLERRAFLGAFPPRLTQARASAAEQTKHGRTARPHAAGLPLSAQRHMHASLVELTRSVSGTQHLRGCRSGLDLAALLRHAGAHRSSRTERSRLPGIARARHPPVAGWALHGGTDGARRTSARSISLRYPHRPHAAQRVRARRPASGPFSTDESVTSLRVATRRRSFLPWALIPSEVPQSPRYAQGYCVSSHHPGGSRGVHGEESCTRSRSRLRRSRTRRYDTMPGLVCTVTRFVLAR